MRVRFQLCVVVMGVVRWRRQRASRCAAGGVGRRARDRPLLLHPQRDRDVICGEWRREGVLEGDVRVEGRAGEWRGGVQRNYRVGLHQDKDICISIGWQEGTREDCAYVVACELVADGGVSGSDDADDA